MSHRDTLIVCHCDNDGKTAGAIARKATGGYTITTNYGNFNVEEYLFKNPEFKKVIVVDMSVDPDVMERLLGKYELIWIDHHLNAIDVAKMAGLDPPGNRSTERSAAWLCWVHFNEDREVPNFVRLVDDYDRWVLSDPDSIAMHYGLDMLDTRPGPKNDALWDKLLNWDKELCENLLDTGRQLYTYIKTSNEILIRDTAFELFVDGHPTLAANYRGPNSMVFDTVKTKKHDILMSFGYYGNIKRWRNTVYGNNPDVDVSVVAASRNGGGHKGAGGWTSESPLELNAAPQFRDPSWTEYTDIYEPLAGMMMNSVPVMQYTSRNESIGMRAYHYRMLLKGEKAIFVNTPVWNVRQFLSLDFHGATLGVSYTWTNLGKWRWMLYPLNAAVSLKELQQKFGGEIVNGKLITYHDTSPDQQAEIW